MEHGQVSKEDEEQVVEWREGEGITKQGKSVLRAKA